MLDWLSIAYPWIKALHIISIIAWMAAMLYQPRLFVYHCGVDNGSKQSELFKVMERRLQRAIMTPAMISSFLFGGLLLATPGLIAWNQGWIHVKLTCVLIMAAMHGMLSKWRREFAEDRNWRTAHFYRLMNEVPTLLMIIIVIMVVVKPF